jgi:hypothetical protein
MSSLSFFITINPLNNVPSGEAPDGVIQSNRYVRLNRVKSGWMLPIDRLRVNDSTLLYT